MVNMFDVYHIHSRFFYRVDFLTTKKMKNYNVKIDWSIDFQLFKSINEKKNFDFDWFAQKASSIDKWPINK